MFFVYKVAQGILISEDTLRNLRPQYKNIELLTRFHRIQDARAYAERSKFPVIDTVKKKFTGVTEEMRQKMRDAKLGEKNPNYQGKALDEQARKKISLTISRQRKGEFHHMWNRRHRVSSRMKTSITMKNLPKRMWVLDSNGREHLVFLDFELPEGWTRGRRRGVLR